MSCWPGLTLTVFNCMSATHFNSPDDKGMNAFSFFASTLSNGEVGHRRPLDEQSTATLKLGVRRNPPRIYRSTAPLPDGTKLYLTPARRRLAESGVE